MSSSPPAHQDPRRIVTAEILSIGSEITIGDTRDTNAGDIARTLTAAGVAVRRVQALPDELASVRRGFEEALAGADLVVSTGGLGPTPDDLTREAIAAMCGEEPAVDADLESWLRALWARRGMPFPEMNLKQAWRISSATPIPNENGTAPGWWVDRPDGAVVVALPGPPREMRPMWDAWVLPRLRERGLGRDLEQRTLRLAGIGESQAAVLIGAELLASTNPTVATYARADAVDVRIAAFGGGDGTENAGKGRSARALADAAEEHVLAVLGGHVWARGRTTWPEAIEEALTVLGWRLATVEVGTAGTVTALLGAIRGLRRAELIAETPDVEGAGAAAEPTDLAREPDGADAVPGSIQDLAARAHAAAGTDVALAVRASERGEDTVVSVAVATAAGVHRERRVAFLGGDQGRSRAALTAAHILLEQLRRAADAPRRG